MSWEKDLIDLYDKNDAQIGKVEYRRFFKNGKEEKIPYVLLPPFHTTVTSQIQVVLSAEGEFLDASKVIDEDKFTVIPVTEASASRTSGKAPHPLCDNLKYLAGDYGRYVPEKTDDAEICHGMYMEALGKWDSSEYTHEKVHAVYQYLQKSGNLIRDLVDAGVLVTDEEGHLNENIKIETTSQTMAFIRFVIRSKNGMQSGQTDECWKDRTLQDCFIKYYQSMGGRSELDFLTGEMQPVSYLHSKKIRNEGDGAKLISSNDSENFTYRGRFATKEQAFSIGSKSYQKLHNALKWIIRKQGRSFDTLMMVTWESDMKDMPLWDGDTEEISSAEEDDEYEGEDETSDGNPITAQQFYSALEGYRKKVNNTSRMILIALDAATPGRLALAEYKTLETSRYLENIKKWHETCGWIQYKQKDGKRKGYYGVPGVRDIADILYGVESKGKLTISDKNGKKLYARLSSRLLPCIWDGRNIPPDLVMTAVSRASMPQAYKERYNWERVLALACSFVKKKRYEIYKEEWNVAVKEECTVRDYLYGRLLALADRIEYRTYDKDRDFGRVTNAKRYMSTFSQRPYDTWKIIEENLQPYLNKLPAVERKYYENILDSINSKFTVEDYCRNDKLDGLYLLGFHNQSYDLKQYKKQETDGGKENE